MRYKIGDVARILGISTDLIRYYEERGIVSPEKDPNNNYRYYDTWDINYLIDCLWYKQFGFGIDEIAGMASAITVDELTRCLDAKQAEIAADLRRQELLLERIRQYRESLMRIRSFVGKCDVRQTAEFVCYLNRHNAQYDNRQELQRLSRQWLKYMPFTKRYFEVSLVDVLDNGDDYSWGFSLGMKYVREFGLAIEPPIRFMPSRLCIHSAFKSSGKGAFSPRRIGFMKDWAEENSLTIAGNAFGNLACSALDEGKTTGFFEVWLPVEPKVHSLR
ncbi:MAG: MerR family transcriptional regulator [Oscillospiraceae bacterium]|nr:MerR family transcriptional regulator [Oscillospiraceae bacterium]